VKHRVRFYFDGHAAGGRVGMEGQKGTGYTANMGGKVHIKWGFVYPQLLFTERGRKYANH